MAWPTVSAYVMFNNPSWTDITPYLREVNIKRGVSRVDTASPLLRYDAGTATLTLDNRDRRFDPTNLSGPYVSGSGGSGTTGIKLFKLSGSGGSVLPWGHGVTVDVKSATGQTASIANVQSKASGTTGSFTVSRPTGTANGKLMIAFHSADIGTLSNLGTPSGGTPWLSLGTFTTGDDTLQTKVWYKTAGSSEPSTYSFSQNSGSDGVAAVACINNADTATTPVIAFIDNQNASVFQTPSTVPNGANDLEIGWVAGSWGDYSPYRWEPPEGYVEYADRQSGGYTTGSLAARSLSGVATSGQATRVLPMRPVKVTATYPFQPTTNRVLNPSFEVDSSNWSAGSAQANIAVSRDVSWTGQSSLYVQRLATSPSLFIYGATAQIASGMTSGTTVTVSAYVNVPAASFDKVTGVSVFATGIASTFVQNPPAADTWYRISLTTTLTATLNNLQIQFWTNDGHSDGQIVAYIDAVQAEVSNSATPYCDGSQPGCTWTGTANASSSTRPSSVTFDLFTGYVDQWNVDWLADVDSTVTVPCTDGFKVLSGISRSPVSPVGAGETTGARINRILDSAGWSGAARRIATGDSSVQATTLDGDCLSELYITSDSEIGELYIDGSGNVVFRNRQAIFTDTRSTNVQARFGDGGSEKGEIPYHEVSLSYDDQQIVNHARITRVGGSEQVAQDTASINEYLRHSLERSDLIFQSDAESLSYAQWIVNLGREPELRFDTLVLRPQKDEDVMFPQVLTREIGDRISATRRPVGGGDPVYREVFIRGIEHNIQQWNWETSWVLQSAIKAGTFLTLGHPTLGKIGRNALVY